MIVLDCRLCAEEIVLHLDQVRKSYNIFCHQVYQTLYKYKALWKPISNSKVTNIKATSIFIYTSVVLYRTMTHFLTDDEPQFPSDYFGTKWVYFRLILPTKTPDRFQKNLQKELTNKTIDAPLNFVHQNARPTWISMSIHCRTLAMPNALSDRQYPMHSRYVTSSNSLHLKWLSCCPFLTLLLSVFSMRNGWAMQLKPRRWTLA